MAGKDIMLDPRAGIRKAGAMPPLMALLREVVEVRQPDLAPAHPASTCSNVMALCIQSSCFGSSLKLHDFEAQSVLMLKCVALQMMTELLLTALCACGWLCRTRRTS